jgi:DNA-binding response OmpR family regulator
MTLPTKTKILVAEDDPAVLDLVARWLEAAGYWVVKARDGERVIEAVREAAPAAIVMDLTMPRMDGFQVLAGLRSMNLPPVPVLVLTGRHSAEDVRRVVSLGARDYLTKPVERAQLLARVERLLRNAAAAAPPPAAQPKAVSADGDDHFLD